jgi:hypothetical protein
MKADNRLRLFVEVNREVLLLEAGYGLSIVPRGDDIQIKRTRCGSGGLNRSVWFGSGYAGLSAGEGRNDGNGQSKTAESPHGIRLRCFKTHNYPPVKLSQSNVFATTAVFL